MEKAGLNDMRGAKDLPLLFQVLDKTSAPSSREAREESLLKSWLADGAYRLDNGHGNAVAIMDAWWSLLIPAMYNDVMGDVSTVPVGFDNSPSAVGSAYEDGFYGQVWTDLSMLLGTSIKGPTHRSYCGGTISAPGSINACSAALWASLKAAGDSLAQQQGANPANWNYQPQVERIRFLPAAAISMAWVNRPTFQQIEEFTGHRPGTSVASSLPQGLPNTSGDGRTAFVILGILSASAVGWRLSARRRRRLTASC
jgi:LPXTG-motif cell wall-anchored protein